ncbi:hypothetical protein SAMD00019534_045470 [Acytostelium subglobosum LB1]|uniref:hypothetical protein n=1 Tax=Acytostelium subglobosum LB1 TaxID=1410327 RepID=UPI000644C35B|nr:hypothetical protein SAMD00019534_045470 [Acytostelium subglobosum LB1]GAM21372.1 hypothetical protein SAMD00019534_045470 [Acytostelium subglobosum LB1]|eukprot:XP_012755491.1 hypothetical protein SAMD00019534_045470 [Acytostelium subglobosum LB1]
MLVSKYTLFVEIGRVVFINFGAFRNKTAIILDVLDQNRVLVHGPSTGVPRHVINLKWISLSKLKLNILRGARTGTLNKAIKAADLDTKISGLRLVKAVAAHEKKAASTDFERFKARIAKKVVNHKVALEVRKMVKAANVARTKKQVANKRK